MSARVTDRLVEARRRRFVGRSSERDVFRNAVIAPDLAFQLLFVYGPGGVGKTTLLYQYLALCEQIGLPAVYVDARSIEPTPTGFVGALEMALGTTLILPDVKTKSNFDIFAFDSRRRVILVDTYEVIASLDGWLRDEFLAGLPQNTLVVLAGRNPPAPGWRSDPGWQDLIHLLPLRNLLPEESRSYLTMRSIPPEQHQTVLEFTHGHPLALSLVADVYAQRPGINFQPQVAPDVVKTLLEQFVQKVPGPAHRAALEACVLTSLTTESLLAQMLATNDAHDLFEWLRGLSFIESSPRGLFPHDLAREALATDLRWRNPDWYRELHRRARLYYTNRLGQTRGLDQQQTLFDLVYLHRDNPMVRPFFEWQEASLLVEPARETDYSTILRIVKENEGDESARLADYWLWRQPRGVLVFRDSDRQIAGFLVNVALDQMGREESELDPAIGAALEYLANHAPLRSGEAATLFRFWMARDTYQAVSPVQSAIFINMVRHYLTTQNLAFHFLPCADPEFWAPGFAYADLQRLPEADFEIGGKRYGVYGHDWRVLPPADWLTLLAEREVASEAQDVAPGSRPVPLVVLSQPDFAAAIKAALRDLLNPGALRQNPLVQSRVITLRSGSGTNANERAGQLQSLLMETIESLQSTPKDAKLYRAMFHTFVKPAPTQESAAELLDLPFSTFRRHLKAGVDRVTEILWLQELGR